MSSAAPSPFHHYDLLGGDEVRHWREVVHHLRQVWIARDPELPFFTLGAAAYLDVSRGPGIYEQFWRLYNPLVLEAFAPLLQQVQACLAQHLGTPVAWHPQAAVPGFHIFQAHPAFCGTGGKVHLDLQYQNLSWEGMGEPDGNSVLSFTLPLALPTAGGGLKWWGDPSAQRWMTLSAVEKERATAPGTESYLPYKTGRLVLHSGHVLHQIAPGREFDPRDERITLQGHGLQVGGRFLCYW